MQAGRYKLEGLRQRTDAELVLGVLDDPDAQAQVPDYYRPDDDGNIVYFGAGGSGKTSALRGLALAAAITPRGGLVHSFTGSLDEMRRLVALGLHVGVNGCSLKTAANVDLR